MTESEELLERLEALYMLARRRFGRKRRIGRARRHPGAGQAWGGHRAYAPGDDYRSLDWPIYGRLERLFVRLFDVEEDRAVAVLVDRSLSMAVGRPHKLDLARRVAAAIAYLSLANLERVVIFPFAETLGEPYDAGRGRGRALLAIEFLSRLAAAGTTDLAAAARSLAQRLPRAGICFVLTDLLDPDPAALGALLRDLRARRFDVFVVQVLSPLDRDPPLDGDVVLVDAETGEAEARRVTGPCRRAYRDALDAWCRDAEAACAKAGADYIRVESETPFDEVVIDLFRRGAL